MRFDAGSACAIERCSWMAHRIGSESMTESGESPRAAKQRPFARQGIAGIGKKQTAKPVFTIEPTGEKVIAKDGTNNNYNLLGGDRGAIPIDCVCETFLYKVGDRVVSLVDSPDGNTQIMIGSMGTLVCGDLVNAWNLPLLVEWDDITNGHDGYNWCDCGASGGNPGSTQCWLVQCDWVEIVDQTLDCVCASLYTVGDRVRLLIDNPHKAPGLLAGASGTVVCGWSSYNQPYVRWDNWDEGNENADFWCDCESEPDIGLTNQLPVYCDWLERIPEIDCVCNAQYYKGDRVQLQVDNPHDTSLLTGDLGTVVCGWDTTKYGEQLFVRWDNFNEGHENSQYCSCETDDSLGIFNISAVQCDWVLAANNNCPEDLNSDTTVNIADILALIAAWGPCGTCDEDISGDGNVDISDLLALMAAWGICPIEFNPVGACVLAQSQICTIVSEVSCFGYGGIGWAEGGSCVDTDLDRIPDVFELGDCSVPNAGYAGSFYNVRDSDNDGINDGDEVYGTLDGLDLPLFGCNPCRYDILVEVDWVFGTGIPADSYKLHANQAANVVASFANAPLWNFNWTVGVTLHLDYGQYPYNGGNSVADPSGNDVVDMDTWGLDGSEYQAIKDANFAANRDGYFHYSLSVWKFSLAGVTYTSSGVSEINGDDFILATGQYFVGDDDRVSNTFMHELGHNLNLRHGGFENLNYKPNYNSVMNYRYQMCGVDVDGDTFPDLVLDYSSGNYIDLNESNLNETIGVTGVGPAIDWDLDGNSNETGINRNINCKIWDAWNCGPYALTTKTCGSGSNCGDSSCNVISDYNDWLNIVYSGISESDFAPKEIIYCGPGERIPIGN